MTKLILPGFVSHFSDMGKTLKGKIENEVTARFERLINITGTSFPVWVCLIKIYQLP